MDYFQYVLNALFQPFNLTLLFSGVIIGIIFGAIPGLTGALAIVLLLPFTFMMKSEPAIILLVSIYIGGISGGFIASTLIGIPGTPASIATTLEAWPLAKKGGTVKALGIGIVASFIGTFFSGIIAMFLSPVIAEVAVKLGPWEFFGLCLLAISLIISLSEGDVLKGLAAACIGFLMGSVGFAPVCGTPRFTFGILNLGSGFTLSATMMGFLAVRQVLVDYGKKNITLPEVPQQKIRGLGFTAKEFFANGWNMIRSFFIGLGIGFLPGMGSGISSFVAYAQAKSASKHPEEYGNGTIEGIFATETANNATIGGAVVPMIALGIPGDSTTALLLGALTIQGLEPGPLLMVNNPHFAYVLFGALLLGAIVTLIAQILGMRFFPKLLNIKFVYMFPVIMLLCFIGAFSDANSIFNVGMVVVCGLLGFLLTWGKFPITPLVLAYILSPMLETYLRRGISYTDAGFLTFFTRPVSAILMLVAVLAVIQAFLKPVLKKRKEEKKAAQ